MRPILATLLFAALVAAPSAGASDTVTVTLIVDAEPGVALAECDVTVPAGADAVDVLARAEADGCIDSYETRDYSFGRTVECVNGVCTTCPPPLFVPCAYWAFRVDGEYASYGVDAYSAEEGDEVRFTYEFLPLWIVPSA